MNNFAQHGKYLYEIEGIISSINNSGSKAQINFEMNDGIHCAYLKVSRFYADGRKVSEDDNLNKYIKVKSPVQFSCHMLDSNLSDGEDQRVRNWMVTTCWKIEPYPIVSYKQGILSTCGIVVSLKKRHGIVETNDQRRVYFIASRYYHFGKRFQASKPLKTGLSINDTIFFDAIPCLKDENEEQCEWFATIVFKGKRPDAEEKNYDTLKPLKAHSDVREVVKQATLEPRCLFTFGEGTYMTDISDDLGVILGNFKYNKFDTVLFSRQHAFAFNNNLSSFKLSDIFAEGDRLTFVAVPAPPRFICNWIAVQVAVFNSNSALM